MLPAHVCARPRNDRRFGGAAHRRRFPSATQFRALNDPDRVGVLSGGTAARGPKNKLPFVATGLTAPAGHCQLICLRQQPRTAKQQALFAAKHIAPSATVISEGLGRFRATQIVGAAHERLVATCSTDHAFDVVDVCPSLPRRIPPPLQTSIQDTAENFADQGRVNTNDVTASFALRLMAAVCVALPGTSASSVYLPAAVLSATKLRLVAPAT